MLALIQLRRILYLIMSISMPGGNMITLDFVDKADLFRVFTCTI